MNCRFVFLCFVLFYYFYVPMFVVGYFTYFLSQLFLKSAFWLLCQHIYKNGMNYGVQSALSLTPSCFWFYTVWCVTLLYLYICVIYIELNFSVLTVYSGTSYFFLYLVTLKSTADATSSYYLMYVISPVGPYCCTFYVFYAVSITDLMTLVPAW